MPRVLCPRIAVRTSLVVSLLLMVMALPGGQSYPWNSLRTSASVDNAFTVNSVGDGVDNNPGDAICDDGTGACTLRAAIQESNSTVPGTDTINFSLPANSVITLSTALPDILGGLTINGPGAGVLSLKRSTAGGIPQFRVFTVSTGTVSISGITITNGSGGIQNNATLTLTGVAVTNNLLPDTNAGHPGIPGGGIYNNLGANLTLSNSTVSGNRTGHDMVGGFGGGIANDGIMSITNSTVSGNRTAGQGAPGYGGGVYNSGTLTITDSTVAVNQTGDGSGPSFSDYGSGGGIRNNSGTINLKNTIVANNTISNGAFGPDLYGGFNSQDYNLIKNISGATFTGTTTHNITGADPLLGSLASNGGPTSTHALLFGSPAIDVGSSAQTTDQRGQPRPVDDITVANVAGGNASDIGAYEAHLLQVNSTADSSDDSCAAPGTGNGCTLREAITAANAEAGGELIIFAAALTAGGPATITLSSPLPDLTSDMTVSGPGANLLTVERTHVGGAPDFRIFNIGSGNSVVMSGLTISNGRVGSGPNEAIPGGGISNAGTLSLSDSTVSGNSSSAPGGGIQNTGILTLNSVLVSANIGGGVANNIFGGSPTTTINRSIITGNTTNGGVYNNALNGTANLTINNSTISNNSSSSVAGGGGIFHGAGSFTSRATLTINNSTISGNSATAGQGGGIYSAAVFGNALTTLTITNSTITANSSSGNGGGILHFSNGSGSTAVATLTNCTVVGNSAGNSFGAGGGIHSSLGSSVTTFSLRNTIVGKNTASPVANAPDLSGEFDSQDYNFIQNTAGATFSGTTTHNLIGLEPNLAALGDYGGPTQTMIPLPNSAAIDAGDISNLPPDTSDADGDGNTAEQLPVDQRGFSRVVNTRFDLGAVETSYSITATAGSGQSATINTDFATQLKATVTESGNLRSGISVFFTRPATGASVVFARAPLIITDANGVAAIGISANGIAGGYNVGAGFFFSPLPAATFNLTNLKAPTTTSVTSSLNPSEFGEIVTFTATITSGSGIPTGTVQFKIDGVGLGGPVPLDGAGVTSRNTTSLTVGSHVITADYSGDANFNPSPGTLPIPQVVNLELALNDVSVTEGDSGTRTANFTVTLTAGSNVQVKVDYGTANGSATAGSDYQSTSGTLIFAPGETTQPVSVTVNGDINFESNETLLVNLSNPINAVIRDAQGVGTISNDDAQGGFISFSQANYSVGESGGGVTITVSRTNDLSGAATVDYATSDASAPGVPCATTNGNASSRCDYTSALGTLRFAAGENSKAFRVLISQDNYVEGQEALSLTLSNPTGGALFITPSTANLTITDDLAEPATNPVDDPDVFVRQHYHDFLNREADPSGLAFWINQITECQQPGATCNAEVRRINVSAAFFLSIEFQETGYLAERLYKSAYGDANGTSTIGGLHQLAVPIVRFNEFLADTQEIGLGLTVGAPGWEQVLENNKAAFVAEFVQRARFKSNYVTSLSPSAYVDRLFLNAGVTPSASDRQAAIDEFGGAMFIIDASAQARALRRVAENSLLKQQETNRAFVLMQYFGYLRRDPNVTPDSDYSGYDFWLTKLNQFNGNFVNAEMVKAFISSDEYRHRFGL